MAQPVNKTIELTRGDTFSEEWILQDINGDPQDITGWDVNLDVRRTKDSPPILEFSVGNGLSVTGVAGKVLLNIFPDDTKDIEFSGDVLNLVYDLEYTTLANNVLTLVAGNFTINKDVTRDD